MVDTAQKYRTRACKNTLYMRKPIGYSAAPAQDRWLLELTKHCRPPFFEYDPRDNSRSKSASGTLGLIAKGIGRTMFGLHGGIIVLYGGELEKERPNV
jgi:hypothetical protein